MMNISPQPISIAKYKVIIFDLDDTLFDTWGKCTQQASREACAAMMEAGLQCTLEECVSEREASYLLNPRKDPYAHLVQKFGVRPNGKSGEEVMEIGRHAFQSRKVESDIAPFSGVQQTLAELKFNHLLFLVTAGTPETQQQKVTLLKIKDFFNHIFYVDTFKKQRKTSAFLKIAQQTNVLPHEVLCVGDRIDREISEGKILGFATALLEREHNRHFHPRNPAENPDYHLQKISDLTQTLKL
ncbi:MAG: HAD family hydrolase [Bdellovibrionales bacterium]